jgi:hypothetical protein
MCGSSHGAFSGGRKYNMDLPQRHKENNKNARLTAKLAKIKAEKVAMKNGSGKQEK